MTRHPSPRPRLRFAKLACFALALLVACGDGPTVPPARDALVGVWALHDSSGALLPITVVSSGAVYVRLMATTLELHDTGDFYALSEFYHNEGGQVWTDSISVEGSWRLSDNQVSFVRSDGTFAPSATVSGTTLVQTVDGTAYTYWKR